MSRPHGLLAAVVAASLSSHFLLAEASDSVCAEENNLNVAMRRGQMEGGGFNQSFYGVIIAGCRVDACKDDLATAMERPNSDGNSSLIIEYLTDYTGDASDTYGRLVEMCVCGNTASYFALMSNWRTIGNAREYQFLTNGERVPTGRVNTSVVGYAEAIENLQAFCGYQACHDYFAYHNASTAHRYSGSYQPFNPCMDPMNGEWYPVTRDASGSLLSADEQDPYTLTFVVTVDADTFDADAYRTELATFLGVRESQIAISVSPAARRARQLAESTVTAEIETADSSTATALIADINMMDAAQLSAAVGVTVTSITSVSKAQGASAAVAAAADDPAVTAAADDAAGGGGCGGGCVGGIVGGICLGIFGLLLSIISFMVWQKKSPAVAPK